VMHFSIGEEFYNTYINSRCKRILAYLLMKWNTLGIPHNTPNYGMGRSVLQWSSFIDKFKQCFRMIQGLD